MLPGWSAGSSAEENGAIVYGGISPSIVSPAFSVSVDNSMDVVKGNNDCPLYAELMQLPADREQAARQEKRAELASDIDALIRDSIANQRAPPPPGSAQPAHPLPAAARGGKQRVPGRGSATYEDLTKNPDARSTRLTEQAKGGRFGKPKHHYKHSDGG